MAAIKSLNFNHFWATLMIEELIRNGADTFFISPGSRSSPLTLAVADNPKAKNFIHLDERGSGFRALGMVSATKKPSVLITTSGTAAANLFPAVIEASKKKLPLIVLTADRPPELRSTGAHQTIDQTKIYGDYVRWYFDLPCPTTDIAPEFVLTTVDQAVSRTKGELGGPVHINCMYREPLVPTSLRSNSAPYTRSILPWQRSKTPFTKYILPKTSLPISDIKQITEKIKSIKSGIIVVGKLSSDKERKSVVTLAEKLNWPIFPDISSGLRLGADHKNIIPYFDQILLSDKFRDQHKVDGILHFGGRITSKRWYQCIETLRPKQYIMAINHPLRNDPLHNITTRVHCNVASLAAAVTKHISKRGSSKLLSDLKKVNTCVDQAIDKYLWKQDALTEPQTARLITEHIPANGSLFIASSMPIREVDMYGTPNRNSILCGSNRGASGIDGTIATAVGYSTGLKKRTTLLIGDLAFLYDLNSLTMLRSLDHPMVIIVQNNNGGGIFSFLPVNQIGKNFEKFFGTPHHLTFSKAADLFDLNYAQVQTADEFVKTYSIALKGATSTIIEIPTDRAKNLKIHQQMQTNIKKAINTTLNKTNVRSDHGKNNHPIRRGVNLGNSRKLRRYQVR